MKCNKVSQRINAMNPPIFDFRLLDDNVDIGDLIVLGFSSHTTKRTSQFQSIVFDLLFTILTRTCDQRHPIARFLGETLQLNDAITNMEGSNCL